jgi:hypothetical protein
LRRGEGASTGPNEVLDFLRQPLNYGGNLSADLSTTQSCCFQVVSVAAHFAVEKRSYL